ncbi:helix-turn-helix domain-containing protein [Ensifer sp. ZNC0028]|uniref:winged helix-turn-helix transcriptional regulator n=1 Tax=Ensifer sp. ZNC0028 TaxID=1339236 RepID=UPI00068D59F2|nr:helix-turn-helix domain-containing protein [Ensifer sp. ZNC0028]
MKLPPQAGAPSASNPDVFDASCSARHALELISTKWAILIMSALAAGPMRNGALLRKVEGISQKMLTQTLKDLERNGLVQRHDQQTNPPHVEYSLSAVGLSLSETLISLDRWAERNFPELDRFREKYDTAASEAKAARRRKIRLP